MCALLAACGGGGSGDDDATLDATPGVDAAAPVDAPGGCAPDDLDACVYHPAGDFASTVVGTRELSYTDVSGQPRSFRVEVRAPVGATGPLPLIIYSHGGALGLTDPSRSGLAWGEAFTRAGYLFVAIAHPGRSDASRGLMCEHFGITDVVTCAMVKYLHFDRPNDVRVLLDEITRASGPLAGMVDTSRILYMGHSAGAGGTSMVGGATRIIYGAERSFPDPRPVAFIGASIEGPGDDGFTDASYGGMTRPHLSLTGVGDVTPEATAPPRRRPFELMPPGHKYRVWITEAAARHESFNHESESCAMYQASTGGPAARCAEHLRWLESAALAFADAHVRGRAEAAAWLASDDLSILAAGGLAFDRR